jgi:hypothetical protein
MAGVVSKQQTTALFLSTTVTRKRRHTELTKKLINLMGNLCCAREQSVQYKSFFIHQLMHKRIVLKTVLKFTLKQLRHVSMQLHHHQEALLVFAKVTVVKIIN